jgi:hypothetical protein
MIRARNSGLNCVSPFQRLVFVEGPPEPKTATRGASGAHCRSPLQAGMHARKRRTQCSRRSRRRGSVDIVAPEPWTAQESTAVSLMDVQRQSTATTAMGYPCRHHTNQPLVFGEPSTDPWVRSQLLQRPCACMRSTLLCSPSPSSALPPETTAQAHLPRNGRSIGRPSPNVESSGVLAALSRRTIGRATPCFQK